MNRLRNNISCVVRAVGERTAPACVELLQQYLGSKNRVGIISRAPFSAALRESLEFGIKAAKPWTLIIDADVLCSGRMLENALECALDLPENTFMVHGSVVDKFFGLYRRAGNRLYRTKWLEQALDKIPADGTSLRPECGMCQGMLEAGFRNFKSFQIIGLHDYEQSYADILRKTALFILKHKPWHEHFIKLWSLEDEDRDFQAALECLQKSSMPPADEITVGMSLIDYLPQEIREKWLGQEKMPLAPDAYTHARVEAMAASEMDRRGIIPTANKIPDEYSSCVA